MLLTFVNVTVAQPVVVDFDTYPDGSPVDLNETWNGSPCVTITDQYQDVGIVFDESDPAMVFADDNEQNAQRWGYSRPNIAYVFAAGTYPGQGPIVARFVAPDGSPATTDWFSVLLADANVGTELGTVTAYDSSGTVLYSVTVMTPSPPEPEYATIEISAEGIAEVLITTDADGSYVDDISFNPVTTEPIEAEVDIDPDTLNLKSKGKWVTCYIQPPDGYAVEDIAVGTILLEGELQVEHSDVQDGVLMVKFNRQLLIEYLATGDVTLTVTGELTDGKPFQGSDTIRVK